MPKREALFPRPPRRLRTESGFSSNGVAPQARSRRSINLLDEQLYRHAPYPIGVIVRRSARCVGRPPMRFDALNNGVRRTIRTCSENRPRRGMNDFEFASDGEVLPRDGSHGLLPRFLFIYTDFVLASRRAMRGFCPRESYRMRPI